MNTRPSLMPSDEGARDNWSSTLFGSQETKKGALEWWYRLTAPVQPPANASLALRERARRGRLASTITLLLSIGLVVTLPTALIGSNSANHFLFPSLLVALLLCITALLFNRRGYIKTSGGIVVGTIMLAFFLSLLNAPGGFGVYNLPVLDLLVIPELLAVSLLSKESVFPVALINSLYIWGSIMLQHHAPDLTDLIGRVGYYGLITRPVILQVTVAIVTYLWVRSASQAIERADRAEAIAELEHAMAEQEHVIAEQKRWLDLSIQQIVDTHTRVANGDFNARVPLTQNNVLWQISGSLNNLLSRFQRIRHDEQELRKMLPYFEQAKRVERELQQTRIEAARLERVVRKAIDEKNSIRVHLNGTLLDPLITVLNDKQVQLPQSVQDTSYFSKEQQNGSK